MSSIALILGALAAGMGLGTIFFGGLWWTVTRGLTAAIPRSVVRAQCAAANGDCTVSGALILRTPWVCRAWIACLCGLLAARGAGQASHAHRLLN